MQGRSWKKTGILVGGGELLVHLLDYVYIGLGMHLQDRFGGWEDIL